MPHLIYYQRTGELYSTSSPTTNPLASGYSGAGSHTNNPNSQCIHDLGPIPTGWYSLSNIQDIGNLRQAIRLTPDSNNNMCGRTGFLIHGDSQNSPGWASAGCIILKLSDRQKIDGAGFDRLEVKTG